MKSKPHFERASSPVLMKAFSSWSPHAFPKWANYRLTTRQLQPANAAESLRKLVEYLQFSLVQYFSRQRTQELSPTPHLCESPCLSPGSSFVRTVMETLTSVSGANWLQSDAIVGSNARLASSLSTKHRPRPKRIWYFATGKQYHRQFRSHTFYFERYIAAVHTQYLVVEEHRVEVARAHKS